MRKPGNQIDVDLMNTSRTDTRKLRLTLLLGVQAADGCGLAIHKRLHAEADTVHPLLQKLGKRLVGELSWCAFQRDLGICREVELAAEMPEYLPELVC